MQTDTNNGMGLMTLRDYNQSAFESRDSFQHMAIEHPNYHPAMDHSQNYSIKDNTVELSYL